MLSKEIINGGWKLFYHNGVYLGTVEVDDDGFYKYWPHDNGGYWTAEFLYEVANHLMEANADWNREIDKYFSEKNNFSEENTGILQPDVV